MTILKGEVYKSEGIDQETFNHFDITGKEIIEIYEDFEDSKSVVEEFNEIFEGEYEKVESVDELPEFVYDEWQEWIHEFYDNILIEVLEARETEYMHLSERSSFGKFHIFVEVHR